MSPDTDRIAVPTNGRGPHQIPEPALSGALAPVATPTDAGAPSNEVMSLAFTPRQLAIGFGVIASLLVLLAGLARRRRPDDDAD